MNLTKLKKFIKKFKTTLALLAVLLIVGLRVSNKWIVLIAFILMVISLVITYLKQK